MIRNSETLLVARDNLRAREQVLDRTELQRVWGGQGQNPSGNTGGLRSSDYVHPESSVQPGQSLNDTDHLRTQNDVWNKGSNGSGGGGGFFGTIAEIFSSPPVLLPPICPQPPPEPPPESDTKQKKKDAKGS